jgi:membrane fusion protein (multidrug efflux system)
VVWLFPFFTSKISKPMRIFSLGSVAVAATLFAACQSDPATEQQDIFQVTSPLVADTVITKGHVADIHAIQNVEVRTRIKGLIERILVDEGQTVQEGQTLFVISSKEYQQGLQQAQAAVKAAQAEMRVAEIELDNTQKLFEKAIVAQSELDLEKSQFETAKANLEQARSAEAQAALNLSFAEVRAPFSGIINRIPNKTGSLVDEGTLLTTISNNKEVFAYFNVSENDYLDYAANHGDGRSNTVSLVLANGAMYTHAGKIETTESEFDKGTGNIAFRARFPNPENLLKHGASGKVQVSTTLKNAMLIPQKSTFEIQGNIYVYVVAADSTVRQRMVTPLARLPHLYAIGPGLQANEKIVCDGIQKVRDGDKVRTEAIAFSQVTGH